MAAETSTQRPEAYGGGWYASSIAGALASPQRVIPLLFELVKPTSVADVGCGPGTWLEEWINQGVDDVLGVEGAWLDTSVLRIPRDDLLLHDLTMPLDLDRTFDLALSLEVGEHLPGSAASVLVETLTNAAPVIAFSAAAPLQGGTHHVNEQWPDYWAQLFAARGFAALDVVRPRIWLDEQIAWYYRQNIFLAVREDALAKYPVLRDEFARSHGRILPLVHPDRYLRVARSSPVRLKDDTLGTVYERWPAVRQLRDNVRKLRARNS